jgi:hypothetical protein
LGSVQKARRLVASPFFPASHYVQKSENLSGRNTKRARVLRLLREDIELGPFEVSIFKTSMKGMTVFFMRVFESICFGSRVIRGTVDVFSADCVRPEVRARGGGDEVVSGPN